MSAVSRTPAEKDARKRMMEIPTIIPALRQLVVVASLGSVEIGSAGIENHKGCHNIMYNMIIHIPYIPTLYPFILCHAILFSTFYCIFYSHPKSHMGDTYATSKHQWYLASGPHNHTHLGPEGIGRYICDQHSSQLAVPMFINT